MRFCVLGTLDVLGDDHAPISIRTGTATRLLCLLLAHAPGMVELERLRAGLWPDGPPPTATGTIRSNLTLLRATLDSPARIDTHRDPAGYRLVVKPGELDADEFRDLASRANRAVRSGDPAVAFDCSGRALALWRGRPYPELEDDPRMAGTARALEVLHTKVRCDHFDAGLALGRHAELLPLLTTAVEEHPGEERFRGQLMLALYRSGRTTDAIDVYEDLRSELSEELAIEPSTWLRDLSYAIAQRDPALDPPLDQPVDQLTGPDPAPRTIPQPAQLPSAVRTFVGRTHEIEGLLSTAQPEAALRIHVLHGMAGVGKTALACQVASRLAGQYTDGQLYLDLNGFTERVEALDPLIALERLLDSVGVPADRLPGDLDQRAALWRTHTAGRDLLLLLDNARDEAQVRPLLPGSGGSVVLITSRHRLVALENAQHTLVDVLPPADAVELFRRIVGPDRIRNGPDSAMKTIVDYCGQLPLALRLVAARFATQNSWDLEDLAERLGSTGQRLAHLSAGSYSVASAFELSYLELDKASRRMFRLLGAHTASEVDRYHAADLGGTSVPEAERVLNLLVEVHLLQSEAYGRYRVHDLLRAYAVHLAAHTD